MNTEVVSSQIRVRCNDCGKTETRKAFQIKLSDGTAIFMCTDCSIHLSRELHEAVTEMTRPPRLELAHLRDLVEKFAETDFVSVTELNAATLEWAIFNKVVRVVGTTIVLTPKGIYLLGREANS